jgi:hypothetical protein
MTQQEIQERNKLNFITTKNYERNLFNARG